MLETDCGHVCLLSLLCVRVFTSSDTDAGRRHVETVKKALVGKVVEGFG